MNSFINNLKSIITLDMIIYGLLILVCILVITIVMRSLRIKKVKDELDQLESKYNELKSIPLSFKLNKATALSKVNKEIITHVSEDQKKFDLVQEKLKEFSVLLAEIDDFVYSKKAKKATEKITLATPIMVDCEKAVREVDGLLDEILEQENMQRENINTLKNCFRSNKKRLLENRNTYRQSIEFLDDYIIQIENMFSIFEEWMFASEFNKASDKQNDIKEALSNLEIFLNELPNYYEIACIVLPSKIEEVTLLSSHAIHEGVFLEHLEVNKSIEMINGMISDVVSKLSECHLERIQTILDDCLHQVSNLKEQIEKERQSFKTISDKVNLLFVRVKELNLAVQNIKDLYARVHERFGFENLSGKLNELDDQLDTLNELRFKLESILTNNSVPFSTLLVSFDEVDKETTDIEKIAKELRIKLDNATSDEERAKKQLIKLQLLVNEMRIKITKHRLPSVDEKFDEDIRKANVFIVEIKSLLEETPLAVEQLNNKIKEAIDFIYVLYNSVNNLVGMAIMVENAILFGNKYRSEYSEVDSELTRAELCYTNGQYTKALKIAISTIEKLHPGAYEKLISNSEVGGNANA